MVTGELRSKIDSLWEIFWTGGLTNPLDVIEQMTYLMFIHDLDDSDNLRAKEAAMLGLPYESIFAKEVQIGERTVDGSQLKWSVFHDFPAAKMYSTVQEWVFPFIKNLHGDKESAYSKYMGDAIFKIPTPLMLDKIVTAMDGIYEQMAQLKSADTRGDDLICFGIHQFHHHFDDVPRRAELAVDAGCGNLGKQIFIHVSAGIRRFQLCHLFIDTVHSRDDLIQH